ncbi:DUF2721 domain-containing protein [Brucepastera parasyntrophica]|uniref:DUF2721 domain-containing protein n=1 Tax=Brucepastera parasyntrophica TaxID=2880008 RepID=UPI00210EFDA6|nr:DUF2721 domain-containing protein [Brucepastera parasyntrophica]ULQ59917.1 DUF2721 domain-containing protein [Brucepastera parasyntrophica]
MEFNITTPALLFSAISLLLLAYTNRFLTLASLVRQFVSLYAEKKEDNILKQISNFRIRLTLIKYTQLLGVLSFLCCVFCMFLTLFGKVFIAELIFALSLILMMASLLCSLFEIFISIGALKLELTHIYEETQK